MKRGFCGFIIEGEAMEMNCLEVFDENEVH